MRTSPLLISVSVLALAGCAQWGGPGPDKDKTYAITILHTNDHHGRFWKNRDGEYGMAARKTVVDQIRQEVKAAGGYSLLLASSLGDVCHSLHQHDEALGFYQLAEQLATGLGNLPVRIEALLKQGDVRVELRQPMESLTLWMSASELAREFLVFSLWRDALDRRLRVCKREGLRERVAEVEQERALLNELERRNSP